MKKLSFLILVASLLALTAPTTATELAPHTHVSSMTTSEGVHVIAADVWHAAGYTGNGVKVAIVDHGFQGYQGLISSGELPANVIVHSLRSDGDLEAGQQRGAACAEVIYDVAPGAQLYLVNFETDAEFGNAVDYLIGQGVGVVCCPVGWLGAGPFDGTGPICDIVNRARANGIFWAQSAGDAAQSHWEGDWSDPDGDNLHNFTPDDESQSFAVAANKTIVANLVWDDPWNAAGNDYDLYLYDNAGQVVASSTIRQSGAETPSESLSYNVGPTGDGTYHLVVQKVSASRPAHLELYAPNAIFEHQVRGSSLLVPADASGAVAAGAAFWLDDILENFSSRGPTNDGRLKPEFAAPDMVSSATYPVGFTGTAAAVAHLAGAAALVRGAYPGYSVDDTLAFLIGRAVDRGAAGIDNEYGYGRVSLGAPPESARTATPSPTTTAAATPTPSSTPTVAWTETTIILQQGKNGYAGSDDTYIYQYAPSTNYCRKDALRIGYRQQYAALVRFDLSPIPANAAISQASLQLYATGWSGANITVGAYCITRSVKLCQATWNQAQSGSYWSLPGCNDTATDRRASAESSVTTSGINKWYSFDLTALAQNWRNGSVPNNGVLLRATYSANTFIFASAQYGTLNLRPRLVVTYRSASGDTTPTATGVPTLIPTRTATRVVVNTPTPTPTGAVSSTPNPTHTSVPSPTPTITGVETTITLQQGTGGYSGSENTYIYQYTPDSNNCRKDPLKVGYKQQYAALLRFDLSPIPAGAVVTEAALQLYANGWSGGNITLGTYIITRSVSLCQATWNQAQSGNYWGLPGCNDTATDRRASAQSSVTTSGINRWYSFDLTTAVQGWLNGSLPNNGVLLRQSVSSTDSFNFASARSSTISLRPRLVITYIGGTPATPTSTATGTVTPWPTQAPSVGTLIIGQISDVHMTEHCYEGSPLYYVLAEINQEAQIMTDSGDCTDAGTAQQSMEYARVMSSSVTIPWRAVPGNHDTPSVFERYIGPRTWSWDAGGYRLIGIDTEAINYAALDRALTLEKPCIIVGHFPLQYCTSEDRAKLRQRFIQYRVPLYLAGHTHLDSSRVDWASGTLVVTGQRAGMGHYRLITLQGYTVQSVAFRSAP